MEKQKSKNKMSSKTSGGQRKETAKVRQKVSRTTSRVKAGAPEVDPGPGRGEAGALEVDPGPG